MILSIYNSLYETTFESINKEIFIGKIEERELFDDPHTLMQKFTNFSDDLFNEL